MAATKLTLNEPEARFFFGLFLTLFNSRGKVLKNRIWITGPKLSSVVTRPDGSIGVTPAQVKKCLAKYQPTGIIETRGDSFRSVAAPWQVNPTFFKALKVAMDEFVARKP